MAKHYFVKDLNVCLSYVLCAFWDFSNTFPARPRLFSGTFLAFFRHFCGIFVALLWNFSCSFVAFCGTLVALSWYFDLKFVAFFAAHLSQVSGTFVVLGGIFVAF